MDILKYKEYEGTAEVDITRGVCRGKVLFIDDLVTYEADSVSKLTEEFELAVDDYLATCSLVGKEPQRPFRGLFNVRVAPAIHRAATLRAVADGVSLNDVMVRALDAFLNSRADVNHNVPPVEVAGDKTETFPAVATGKPIWMQYVH